MIIGNDLLLGLSGFLPFLFHRISYRYIKQQPFIGRNTNEFLNLLFIEPSQIHDPNPSLSAASVMWAAAIPISIKGKYLSFILAPKRK